MPPSPLLAEFSSGSLFDVRVEVHSASNASSDHSVTITKVPGGAPQSLDSFFGVANQSSAPYTYSYATAYNGTKATRNVSKSSHLFTHTKCLEPLCLGPLLLPATRCLEGRSDLAPVLTPLSFLLCAVGGRVLAQRDHHRGWRVPGRPHRQWPDHEGALDLPPRHPPGRPEHHPLHCRWDDGKNHTEPHLDASTFLNCRWNPNLCPWNDIQDVTLYLHRSVDPVPRNLFSAPQLTFLSCSLQVPMITAARLVSCDRVFFFHLVTKEVTVHNS